MDNYNTGFNQGLQPTYISTQNQDVKPAKTEECKQDIPAGSVFDNTNVPVDNTETFSSTSNPQNGEVPVASDTDTESNSKGPVVIYRERRMLEIPRDSLFGNDDVHVENFKDHLIRSVIERNQGKNYDTEYVLGDDVNITTNSPRVKVQVNDETIIDGNLNITNNTTGINGNLKVKLGNDTQIGKNFNVTQNNLNIKTGENSVVITNKSGQQDIQSGEIVGSNNHFDMQQADSRAEIQGDANPNVDNNHNIEPNIRQDSSTEGNSTNNTKPNNTARGNYILEDYPTDSKILKRNDNINADKIPRNLPPSV